MKRRDALLLPALGIPQVWAQTGAQTGAQAGVNAGVRVVGASAQEDPRYEFPLRLLQALLHAAGLAPELAIQPHVDQPQAAIALSKGQLDIALLSTQTQPMPGLTPLRFPIRRGLLGARLLLARRESLPRFRNLRSLAALQRGFVMGYGEDWQDRALLQRLGFRMHLEPKYPDLFRALARGRFDYLSRGINEVWAELDHPLLVPHGIVVVPRLALSYPLDDYFFLGPSRQAWLPLLQAGMEKLWRSGAYFKLFEDAFGRALERADFEKRLVLQVVGYGVQSGTPMEAFDALELYGGAARMTMPR